MYDNRQNNTTATSEIIALVKRIEGEYKKTPERIVVDFETEEKTKKEYATRQFFELLQNADDQAEESGKVDANGNPILKKVHVKVTIRDKKVIIQNTGEPFSVKGIRSLIYPSFSPKKYLNGKKKETIGYKGLGFRSLLNWIGEEGSIKIVTKEFGVGYSRQYAKARLDAILGADDCAVEVQEEMKSIREVEQYPIAVLTQPQVYIDFDYSEFLDNGFDTAIVVECDDETIATIENEISRLTFNELLFLKNLESVELIYSDINRVITKVTDEVARNPEVALIEEKINGAYSPIFEWHVYAAPLGTVIVSEKGKSLEKAYEIKIAYPQDEQMREKLSKKGVIYSFFRTDERFPFPYILHATFELEGNRNRIEKNNKTNKQLVEKIVEHMCSTATMITGKKGEDDADYEALQLVLETERADGTLFTNYGFSDFLFDSTKKLKLLPTIKGQYLSIEDEPKYDESGFADVVRKDDFDALLQPAPNEIVENYLSDPRLGLSFYGADETAKRIDASADDYSVEEKARIIRLFLYKFSSQNMVPHILLDAEGLRITNDDAVIFINPKEGDDASIIIPRWAKSHFLNVELENLLYNEFGVKTPRNLADKLRMFSVNQYSLVPVLSGLVAQAKTQSNIIDVAFALYQHWRKNREFGSDISRIPVKVLDNKGEIAYARDVYFGMEWNNKIGAKILSHISDTVYLGTSEQFGMQNYEMESLISFFYALGVRRYPRIKHEKLVDSEKGKYIAFNKLKYGLCSHPPVAYRNGDPTPYYGNCEVEVLSIRNIVKILENVPTNDIILWLTNDVELNEHLHRGNEYGDSAIRWNWGQRQFKMQYRDSLPASSMSPYLSMVFRDVAWVDTTRGVKAQPSKLLIDYSLPKSFGEFFALPKLDDEYLDRNGCGRHRALSELEKLGSVSSIKNLEKELIYKVLLDLPERDAKCEIGGQIYHRINAEFREKAELDRLLTGNQNYEIFKKEGKLLCSNNKGYVDVSKTVYIDKKVVCDAILQDLYAVRLPRRLGGLKIERLFGAKHFKGVALDKVKPSYAHEAIQAAFERQYKMLLPYIYAERVDKDSKDANFRALKKTRITLCETIEITYDDKSYQVRDYENIYSLGEVNEQSVAYIKVPHECIDYHELSSKTDFRISLAEIIAAIIDVSEKQDYYQLIIGMSEADVRKTYLQSNTEENLRIAIDKFGREIDYETEFWETLEQTTLLSITELKTKYKGCLGSDFDFDNISRMENGEKIISIFTSVGKDIKDYNRYAFDRIDFSAFNREKYRQLKKEIEPYYYSFLHTKSKNEGLEYSRFLNAKSDFDLAGVPHLENSISVDFEQVFESQFDVSVADLKAIVLVDISDSSGFYVAPKKESTMQSEESEGSGGNTPTIGINYQAVFNESLNNDYGIKPVELQKSTSHGPGGLGPGHRRGGGRVNPDENRIKQENGYRGECAVYSFLEKEKNEGRIQAFKWISGNAYAAGENNDPKDSAGYDFEYSVDGIDKFFIEVKASSSGGDIEFTMSSNEVAVARRNPKNYKVFFVRIIDEKAVTPINDLGLLFDFINGEDWMLNSRFSIEEDGFKIKTKPK